jgi:hypothetical protein
MMTRMIGYAAAVAGALAAAAPAAADFAFTDLTRVNLAPFDKARWTAKAEPNRLTMLCASCPSVTAVDVQMGDDDGTGERVRSGQTTAESMTAIGRANAARNPGVSEYYGAEAIRRGGAVGFRQEAKALDRFTVTYILWDGGKRFIVRGLSPSRDEARRVAREAFDKVGAQVVR